MNKGLNTKKRYTGISIKILFIIFFIFTVNMASGYLKGTTVSDATSVESRKTQLATPEMAVIRRKDRSSERKSSSFRIPAAAIVVYPNRAKEAQTVRVLWKSKGMSSCEVSGPRGFYRKNFQGAIDTTPFRTEVNKQKKTSAVYTLRCSTLSGRNVVRETTVQLR